MVANEGTHVLDATTVTNVLDFDRIGQRVDFMNQDLVTILSSSHDDYMYDGVTNTSNVRLLHLYLSLVQVEWLKVVFHMMNIMLLIQTFNMR